MTGERRPAPVVVMGVSAVGKSTVGLELARRLGSASTNADDLHPEASRAKMRAGVPLDDEDRRPWLDAVGAVLGAADCGASVVVACSALRRTYRDRLLAAEPSTRFVHLDAAPAVLTERATARSGHFMPPGLLGSQLATLEPLGPDEPGFRIDVDMPVDAIVAAALAALGGRPAEVRRG